MTATRSTVSASVRRFSRGRRRLEDAIPWDVLLGILCVFLAGLTFGAEVPYVPAVVAPFWPIFIGLAGCGLIALEVLE